MEWTEPDGEAVLTGPVRDQAELLGLLNTVFNLNLTLLCVNRVERDKKPALCQQEARIGVAAPQQTGDVEVGHIPRTSFRNTVCKIPPLR